MAFISRSSEPLVWPTAKDPQASPRHKNGGRLLGVRWAEWRGGCPRPQGAAEGPQLREEARTNTFARRRLPRAP